MEKQKGINLLIAEAKTGITEAINTANMPPGIMLMILEEIQGQVRAQNAYMVEAERKAMEEGGSDDGETICEA